MRVDVVPIIFKDIINAGPCQLDLGSAKTCSLLHLKSRAWKVECANSLLPWRMALYSVKGAGSQNGASRQGW